MSTFLIFTILIAIVCFLLIIVVMVQNPKGGGLSSTFGGSQMMGGVQKTTDFLDKSTWVLAGILLVLVLLSSLSYVDVLKPATPDLIEKTEAPAKKDTTPAKETPAPADKK